ncbi:MAG: hypothetical protein F6K26_23815 [Moorea sp. SIO2I5]|nr:hypothetical protein [Moorena sp. SIO2I5]
MSTKLFFLLPTPYLTGVGFLHLGKTWDDREGEEKENNEEMMIVNDKLSILS